MIHPRYPIYIPTKGRADNPLTINAFLKDKVEIRIVVEPQEVKNYERFGRERLCVLPENNRGLVFARNWIKQHATDEGHERHWQFDDDVRYFKRIYKGYRLPIAANIALAVCEDFVDRYENVALASLNSEFFIPCNGITPQMWPPFYLNSRCYTNFLVLNSLPNKWRYRYNEDTDMSLQVLADGWCTILFNAYLIGTPETMTYKGGQTDIYVDDGRLQMARQLERVWPGVVTTKRRYGRPQHIIASAWKKFDTKLKLKPGVDPSKIDPNKYGMKLKAVREVQSTRLRKLLDGEG